MFALMVQGAYEVGPRRFLCLLARVLFFVAGLLLAMALWGCTSAGKYEFDRRWDTNFDKKFPPAVEIRDVRMSNARREEIQREIKAYQAANRSDRRTEILEVVDEWSAGKMWIILSSCGGAAGILGALGLHVKHKSDRQYEALIDKKMVASAG
jgi:hypothetical protein